MATVPTPFDATSGQKLTASQWDSQVRDPLLWLLTNRPRCHVFDGVGVTAVNNSDTLLTFSAETYDNDTMHSTSSNTSRIVFNTAGLYEFKVGIQLPSGSTYTTTNITGKLNANGVFAGGTGVVAFLGTGNPRFVQANFLYNVAANDYMEFWINQISGGNVVTQTGSFRTYVQATWQSN